MKLRLFLVAALLGSFASRATAQVTPEPNTGCVGAMPVQWQGDYRLGTSIRLTCQNVGRANFQMLALGVCGLPSQFTPPFVCTSQPCNLGMALGLSVAVSTNFQPLDFSIPATPSLVGTDVCAQCFDFLLARGCMSFSQAIRITIQR